MGINEHIALFAFNLIGLGLFMLVVSVFGKSRKARIETWQAAAEQFQTYRPDTHEVISESPELKEAHTLLRSHEQP